MAGEKTMSAGMKEWTDKDSMSAAAAEKSLAEQWPGRRVIFLQRTDSTNEYLKRLASAGESEGTLVIADEQTAGKGRSGRSWTTPPGTAIAMSLLLRPQIAPERISMTTLLAGLAVAGACRSLYDLPAMIKWPNDVVLHGRKLTGILTEMGMKEDMVSHIVVGIGINANIRSFPPELSQLATSLAIELGKDISRQELIVDVINRLETYYKAFLHTQDLSAVLHEYNELLANRDQRVRVLDPAGEWEGTAEGINPMGELLVQTDTGETKNVYAGEVSVRGIYGYV